MAIVLMLAPLLITSAMSSRDGIIQGALISVGGKQFLPIFTIFFFLLCYYSYNQVIWCCLKTFNKILYYDHFTSYCIPSKTSDSLKLHIFVKM